MDIKDINSKDDLIYIVQNIINGTYKIKNIEDFFVFLRNKLVDVFLKKGDIPPSEWVKLYFLFKNVKTEKNNILTENINVLENYYENALVREKLLLNNVLFILNMFNGEDYLKEYIKKFFKLNFYEISNNPEFKVFVEFLNSFEDSEILIGVVKYIVSDMKQYDLQTVKNIFGNFIMVMWNIKILYINNSWLKVFGDLTDLIDFYIAQNRIEEQMIMHFFTYHIYGNNIQTIDEWRVFNEKVEKPASAFYKRWGSENLLKPCKKRVSSKKKKIGFLIDRIVNNSPMKVTYSLLKTLSKDKNFNKSFEIKVYSMCYAEKQYDNEEIVQKIKNLGIEVYSVCKSFEKYGILHPHLEKALMLREKIIEDRIDYLISGLGYDIPNFIFSNRSAPKQVFWSHGNCASDIDNIDLRISHFPQECKEHEWKIFNVPIAEEYLLGSDEERKKAEIIKQSFIETYGRDTVFLGTIGRYVKIDSDEYLKVIAEIMKQNPNTVYLACGDGNTDTIKEKLKKYDIPESRFVFTGLVNPHIFGWIIDIWINTFPLSQGQSQEEFFAKNSGWVIQGKLFTEEYKNDYEHLIKNFKERKEFFSEAFETDIQSIDQNVSYDMLRFNIYKKYNDIKPETEKNILECIKTVDSEKSFKNKWYKMVGCAVKSRDYFNMQKWIAHRLWKINQKRKNGKDFLHIFKVN